MKRIIALSALVLFGSAGAAFAVAPDAVGEAAASCCAFLAAMACPFCP